MKPKACIFLLSTLLIQTDGLYAESPVEWLEQSRNTRGLMTHMDETIRLPDKTRAFQQYLALFSQDVQVHGLELEKTTNLEGLKKHYHPVFFELVDGVLLSDEVIVAGNMSAQRYHSMFRLQGSFDGVNGTGQAFHIRGQTFFRWNSAGLISERWSNHDHAFRLEQLQGETGRMEGQQLARALNGTGLSESGVMRQLESLCNAHNRITDPIQRENAVLQHFSDDLEIFGISQSPSGKPELKQYLQSRWHSFPDLRRVDEARLSAWGFGAVRWRAVGAFRESYNLRTADHSPTLLRGEMILKFNESGKIIKAWFNDQAPERID